MSERNDGGPAFPSYEELERYDDEAGKYRDYVAPVGGMSLRDYFAAKAMQAMCASDKWAEATRSQISLEAFAQADEMLRERAK